MAGFSRNSRHLDRRVEELLSTSPDEWLYTVKWPNATSNLTCAGVLEARATAEAVDRYVNKEWAELEARRQRDVQAALKRGQRAGIQSVSAPSVHTRYVLPSYDGLLSSLPAPAPIGLGNPKEPESRTPKRFRRRKYRNHTTVSSVTDKIYTHRD